MASHTFCRAKPIKQSTCSASYALTIVKDLLANGTSSLADDVRTNLYKVESELEVLQGFPENVDNAPRQKLAATAGKATPAGAGEGSDKKERKKQKKHKEPKGGVAVTDGVKVQQPNGEVLGKRKAEKSKDEDGKEKRKKKKQKVDT